MSILKAVLSSILSDLLSGVSDAKLAPALAAASARSQPLCNDQVVKEIAAASRDLSAEDSLYETVKELKDPPPTEETGLPNGTAQPSPDEPPPHPHHLANHHHSLLNGHLSPGTPERGPLCVGVEYASIDLNKKSRHSADLEAKRRSASANGATAPQCRPLEEPEEEVPPPVPEKVLDENDNQSVLINGLVGAGLHNGEVRMIRRFFFHAVVTWFESEYHHFGNCVKILVHKMNSGVDCSGFYWLLDMSKPTPG